MGIFLRQLHKEKPLIWGSFQDRQFSIWRNLEDIYQVNHESAKLIMPLFWGLPPRDYSKFGNHGTNHGASRGAEGLEFVPANSDYISLPDAVSVNTGKPFTVLVSSKIDNTTIVYPRIMGLKSEQGTNCWQLLCEDVAVEWSPISWGSSDTWAARIANSFSWSDIAGIKTDLVITYNGDGESTDTNWKLYRNGASETFVATLSYGTKTNSSALGRAGGSDASYFPGEMYYFCFYNRVLSADKIALFNARPWDLYKRIGRPIYSIASAAFIQKLTEAKYDIILKEAVEAKYDIHLQKLAESKYDIQLQQAVEAIYDILLQKAGEAKYDIHLQKTTEAKYDILLQQVVEALYDILSDIVQKIIEAKYDIVLQKTTEAKYDIQLQKAAESLYDILIKKTGEARYDIYLQKLTEAKYDIYLRKSCEALYDIMLQKISEARYDIALQKTTEARYSIHLQKTIEALYDILTDELVKKLFEAKYDILKILKTIELQSKIKTTISLDSYMED